MTAQFLFITAQIGYHCILELGMAEPLAAGGQWGFWGGARVGNR